MVTIHILKKGWLTKKYYARIIHQNGNILFWSKNQANLHDLEEMIFNLRSSFPTAKIIYD
jgi:hypothetical protein